MNDAGELCQRCGLCCDGTLFSHAPVLTPEAGLLVPLGVPVFQRPDGVPAIAQPCAALEGCRCRVYESRPVACRAFDCLLHDAYAADEVSLEDAVGIVEEARGRVTGLLAELPDSPASSAFERVQAGAVDEGAEARAPGIVERIRRLDRFLDRQFRGSRRR